MAQVFEAHVKVEISLEAMAGGPITYTDRFTVALQDEYDHGHVLAAFIHYIGQFQRDLKALPAAVKAAKDVFDPSGLVKLDQAGESAD